MDQEIKALWVSALRSGEYEQTQGHLTFEGKFCCLGVLCDLAVKRGITTVKEAQDERLYGDAEESAVPPQEVLDWAGLKHDNPGVVAIDEYGDERRPSLIELNDGEQFTFSQIADAIEENL